MKSNTTSIKRKPEWLKIKLSCGESYGHVSGLLKELKLNTVCRSAHCPNLTECWGRGTATFMILGDVCTRSCRFCAVSKGKPIPLDPNEPNRLAEAAVAMKLKWVVITSVTRDDLPDGGSRHFANVVSQLRRVLPDAGVETLVPDFLGKTDAIEIICDQPPDVLNHNIETVPRMYSEARFGASYEHSIWLIKQFSDAEIITKSGIMLGLGESMDEVKEVLNDLRQANCRILTIGQYLAPSKEHLEIARFVHPDEFKELEEYAYQIGFDFVASGPLVRSSYKAEQAGSHLPFHHSIPFRHSRESGNPEIFTADLAD